MSNGKLPSFDHAAYKKIIDDNNIEAIASIFSVALELAKTLKYGPGIINQAMLTDAEHKEVWDAMSPLIYVIEREAPMSFARIFNGVLADPNLNDYLKRRTAANIGKTGGRKVGSQAPHKVWLEGVMRQNQIRTPHARLSAEEHFRMLRSHPDILEEEDEVLCFTDAALDRFGDDSATINRLVVKKMLTHINKKPI